MADISKIAYILSKASPDVLTALRNIVYTIEEISSSGGGLSATGSDIGATAQAQAFTNGVQTAEIKDSSNASAIAVDARVLRDAAGANNVDFSAIPIFLQGLKSNNIFNATNENNLIKFESDGIEVGGGNNDAKFKAYYNVLGLGDPDNEGNGYSIIVDNDNERTEINAPDELRLNGSVLPTVTITAANLLSPTFELVIEKGFVKSFTP